MSDRTENILNMECPCCGNKHQCKMSCERAESFKAFKQTLIWLPFMSDKQLAEMNFEVFVESHERANRITKAEIECLISETNKPR